MSLKYSAGVMKNSWSPSRPQPKIYCAQHDCIVQSKYLYNNDNFKCHDSTLNYGKYLIWHGKKMLYGCNILLPSIQQPLKKSLYSVIMEC